MKTRMQRKKFVNQQQNDKQSAEWLVKKVQRCHFAEAADEFFLLMLNQSGDADKYSSFVSILLPPMFSSLPLRSNPPPHNRFCFTRGWRIRTGGFFWNRLVSLPAADKLHSESIRSAFNLFNFLSLEKEEREREEELLGVGDVNCAIRWLWEKQHTDAQRATPLKATLDHIKKRQFITSRSPRDARGVNMIFFFVPESCFWPHWRQRGCCWTTDKLQLHQQQREKTSRTSLIFCNWRWLLLIGTYL